MRLRPLSVLAAVLPAIIVAQAVDKAAAGVPYCRSSSAAEPRLVVEVVFSCGVIDGKFQCQATPGNAPLGKNATPGAGVGPQSNEPEAAPGGTPSGAPNGTWQGTTSPTAGQTPANPNACPGGMTGTPPNCSCPASSELLGGNCVHYTASTCSNGLAADALPQACRGVEEKLSCKLRDDGLKDCCCVTYDKF
jgi:hypothetical protein